MKKRILILAVACLATVAASTPARATLLSDLIGFAMTINAGSLVFSDFSYLKTGDMPDADAVNIVPYFDGVDWGLKIQGGFHDLPGGGASDALIEFKVATIDPSLTITKVTLAGNPVVLGGTGVMSVVETFIPDNVDEALTIYAIVPGAHKFYDEAVFASGYHSLRVQKDIFAVSAGIGGGNPGIPQLSIITQTYHVIPEPTSVTLAGLGVIGVAVGLARRRLGGRRKVA